jgi:DNA-binding beta-propeller fold protein YncE
MHPTISSYFVNVYVADNGNNRVQYFNATGGYLGKCGSGDGQFNNAYGVALDSNNNVYVFFIKRCRSSVEGGRGRYTVLAGAYGATEHQRVLSSRTRAGHTPRA